MKYSPTPLNAHFYVQFAVFPGKESPHIFSKFNPPYGHSVSTGTPHGPLCVRINGVLLY